MARLSLLRSLSLLRALLRSLKLVSLPLALASPAFADPPPTLYVSPRPLLRDLHYRLVTEYRPQGELGPLTFPLDRDTRLVIEAYVTDEVGADLEVHISVLCDTDAPVALQPSMMHNAHPRDRLISVSKGCFEALRNHTSASHLPTLNARFQAHTHRPETLTRPITPRYTLGAWALKALNPQELLSAPLAPLTVDGIASFYQPCLREEERAAWLVTLQESPTPALERELLICDHLGARHTLKAGATGSNGLEVAQPAVAFAQQLAQRARCFDPVMSAYARNDLRKVVQGLDQWMKVTTALEGEEAGREVHLLKVKFLHLGRFDTLDVVRFVRQGFWSPYLLTSSGEWVASSPLPPLI